MNHSLYLNKFTPLDLAIILMHKNNYINPKLIQDPSASTTSAKMTVWETIRHRLMDLKGKVYSGRRRSKSKRRKEITPQQTVALIGSIVIILMALGGLGLVYKVFAHPTLG